MRPLICVNRWGILLLVLCLFAATRPLLLDSEMHRGSDSASGFPGWSAAPLPAGLIPLAPGAKEKRFTGQFPGKIGVFSDGRATWIVRWIARPSRKLHPAADCLRATGYAVAPRPIFAANDGTHWGVSAASRKSENLIVRERIVDAGGREFTDVSAWFWAAVLEKSTGPWWSVTRMEYGAAR
jgi:hypothetical protein